MTAWAETLPTFNDKDLRPVSRNRSPSNFFIINFNKLLHYHALEFQQVPDSKILSNLEQSK